MSFGDKEIEDDDGGSGEGEGDGEDGWDPTPGARS